MSYENFKKDAQYFARFLDTVGDGTGNFNANVLGSLVSPVDFKLVVPAGKILFIQELVVTVRDNGQFAAGGYGALSTLANGVQIWFKPSGTAELVNRTAQNPMVCNGCWSLIASRYEQRLTHTNDIAHSSVHWFHTPLMLYAGGEYIARIRDDLTGLTAHTFRVHGALHSVELD